MKKIFNLCMLLCLVLATKAQVNIVLNVQPQPPANYNTWSQRNEVITLVAVGSAQGNTVAAKINATLETADGSPVAKTDITRAPIRQIAGGSTAIFYAKDVLDPSALVFNASFQNQLNKTGKLKAGVYKLTVTLVNDNGSAPVSNQQVKIFTVVAAQLPVLIAPANEAILNEASAQTAIVFRWTPLVPRPREPAVYTVLVFEILDGQTPMQALRSNQPILNADVRDVTQYIWRPQLGMAEEGRNKFIWTIKSTDGQGTPYTGESISGDAVSEPYTFSFRKGWDGTVKGGSKSVILRSKDSNVSASVVITVNNSGRTLSDGTPIVNSRLVVGNITNVKEGSVLKIEQASTGDMGKSAIDDQGNFSVLLQSDTLHKIYVNDQEYGNVKIESASQNLTIKILSPTNGSTINNQTPTIRWLRVKSNTNEDAITRLQIWSQTANQSTAEALQGAPLLSENSDNKNQYTVRKGWDGWPKSSTFLCRIDVINANGKVVESSNIISFRKGWDGKGK